MSRGEKGLPLPQFGPHLAIVTLQNLEDFGGEYRARRVVDGQCDQALRFRHLEQDRGREARGDGHQPTREKRNIEDKQAAQAGRQ